MKRKGLKGKSARSADFQGFSASPPLCMNQFGRQAQNRRGPLTGNGMQNKITPVGRRNMLRQCGRQGRAQ